MTRMHWLSESMSYRVIFFFFDGGMSSTNQEICFHFRRSEVSNKSQSVSSSSTVGSPRQIWKSFFYYHYLAKTAIGLVSMFRGVASSDIRPLTDLDTTVFTAAFSAVILIPDETRSPLTNLFKTFIRGGSTSRKYFSRHYQIMTVLIKRDRLSRFYNRRSQICNFLTYERQLAYSETADQLIA